MFPEYSWEFEDKIETTSGDWVVVLGDGEETAFRECWWYVDGGVLIICEPGCIPKGRRSSIIQVYATGEWRRLYHEGTK